MIEAYFAWLLSFGLFFMIIGGLLHFIPSVIAFLRDHQSKWAILALNVLLGWSGIGWIAALIWSLTGVKK